MSRLLSLAPAPAQATILLAAIASAALMTAAPDQSGKAAPTGSAEAPAIPAGTPPAGLPANLSLDELSPDVLARPLILDGRRPVADAAPAEETAAEIAEATEPEAMLAPPPVLRYKGFAEGGDGPQALVAWGEGDVQDEWHDVGYVRDGWTIAAITRDSVTITNGSEELSFSLFGTD